MNDDTDTPQSDAALLHIGWDEHGKECEFVPLKVAREIERDLNEQCVLLGKSAERECALLAKIDRLECERDDAKATADHWIVKAERADEAAADLKDELADTRRHWKEAETGLEFRRDLWQAVTDQLTAERALADRLAGFIDSIVNAEGPYPYLNETSIIPAAYAELKAWKEARSE